MFGFNVTENRQGKTMKIGDNRFFPLEEKESECELSKKHGLIALRGFSSHVTPVDGSVTLNINTAFSAFFKPQTVQEYITAFGNKAPYHLMHVRVRIMYDRCKPGEVDKSKDEEARRTKTITGFSASTARETKFTDRKGDEISVYDHHKNTYPLAKSNSMDSICINTGDTTDGQQCWFLADQLQVLPGQMYRRLLDKLDPELPAKMIDFACQSPETNRNAIMQSGLKALGLDKGTPSLLIKAGITVAPEMMTIPFRRITPPRVT